MSAAIGAASAHGEPVFNLLRRFGLASLAVIVAIAVAASVVLSDFVTEQFLRREARLTADFVQQALLTNESIGFFENPGDPDLARRFAATIDHLRSMAEVRRINVYSLEGAVLWSDDTAIIGKRFNRNDELERALGGELVVEGGKMSATQRAKAEHAGMSAQSVFYVETYMPVRITGRSEVSGVIELYRAPEALTAAITQGHWRIWLSAGLGIGLTLARRAVERFGGTIRAESAVGIGTTMIIELPGGQ